MIDMVLSPLLSFMGFVKMDHRVGDTIPKDTLFIWRHFVHFSSTATTVRQQWPCDVPLNRCVSLRVLLNLSWCKWWETEAEMRGRRENRAAFVVAVVPLFGKRKRFGRSNNAGWILLVLTQLPPVVPLMWMSPSVFFSSHVVLKKASSIFIFSIS